MFCKDKNSRRQVKVSNWQKTYLILFGIAVFIVALELGLRLGGFTLSSLQEHRNLQSIKQKGAFRIMCLGESTTALGGINSWPAQIGDILNQSRIGVKFSVINKGIVGTNTGFLVSQLKSNLDKYQPDLVVTTMGINDYGPRMLYEAAPNSKITSFLKSFKVYKLIRLIWMHIKAKAEGLGFKADYTEEDNLISQEDTFKKAIELNPKNDQAYAGLGRLYRGQGKFPEAEQVLKKAIELNPKNDQAYILLGWLYNGQRKSPEAEQVFKKAIELNPKNDDAYLDLGRFYRNRGKFTQAEDSFKKTIELNPQNYLAYIDLGWICLKQGKISQAEGLFKKAIELNPENYLVDRVYGAMSVLYEEEIGKLELAKEYINKANRLRLGYYNPVTVNNYHKLKEILDKKKIRLVCAQYPMRSVEPLKKIFEGQQEGIIFVDNELIFKDAVKIEGCWAYFIDMFGGDFGHCTPKGNQLLAENIANTIIKEVFHK